MKEISKKKSTNSKETETFKSFDDLSGNESEYTTKSSVVTENLPATESFINFADLNGDDNTSTTETNSATETFTSFDALNWKCCCDWKFYKF